MTTDVYRPSGAASPRLFDEVLYEAAGGIARITINRPARFNAYSTECLRELAVAFQQASFDDAVGVIVLTGAGERAFCTGGDVKEYAEKYVAAPRDYWKYMALFRGYIDSILSTGKPVIARINGIAVGGGNESVLACDLAVMADHAYLGRVGRVWRRHPVAAARRRRQTRAGNALHQSPHSGAARPRVGSRESRCPLG